MITVGVDGRHRQSGQQRAALHQPGDDVERAVPPPTAGRRRRSEAVATGWRHVSTRARPMLDQRDDRECAADGSRIPPSRRACRQLPVPRLATWSVRIDTAVCPTMAAARGRSASGNGRGAIAGEARRTAVNEPAGSAAGGATGRAPAAASGSCSAVARGRSRIEARGRRAPAVGPGSARPCLVLRRARTTAPR